MLEEIKSLFERLLAELPNDAAKLNIYRVPKSDGTVVELVPAKKTAASVGVHVEDRVALVDFSFGPLSTWELPMEGRNRNASAQELLAEIEEMTRAVIAGHCDVTRGLFSLVGRIHVDGHPYKKIDVFLLPHRPQPTRSFDPYFS